MSELIAFIGVGNMGLPMAENLMKSGKKIRVFDVSMMPNIVAANTNAPAMAIADKATDIMLEG